MTATTLTDRDLDRAIAEMGLWFLAEELPHDDGVTREIREAIRKIEETTKTPAGEAGVS